MQTFYEILEVSPSASPEVIKMAYKALVRKYHPDIYKGDINYANEKIKEINIAYEVLGNDIKRREYDAELLKEFLYNQPNNSNTQYRYSSNNTSASNTSSTSNQDYNKTTNTYTVEPYYSEREILIWVIGIIIIASCILYVFVGCDGNDKSTSKYDNIINQDHVESYALIDIDFDGYNELIVKYNGENNKPVWDIYTNNDSIQCIGTWEFEFTSPSLYKNYTDNKTYIYGYYYTENSFVAYISELCITNGTTSIINLKTKTYDGYSLLFDDQKNNRSDFMHYYNEHLFGYEVSFEQKD